MASSREFDVDEAVDQALTGFCGRLSSLVGCLALLGSFGAFLACAQAVGAESSTVDQSVNPTGKRVFASIAENVPIGQEFVPSVGRHLGVRLLLDDRRGPTSGSVTVLIRSETIAGPILASVSKLLELHGHPSFVEFLFDSSLSLNPGQIYVIEVLTSGERWWWVGVEGAPPGPYPLGRPISRGEVGNDPWDMVFETLVPRRASASASKRAARVSETRDREADATRR